MWSECAGKKGCEWVKSCEEQIKKNLKEKLWKNKTCWRDEKGKNHGNWVANSLSCAC